MSARVHALLARLASVMRAEVRCQAAAEGLTPTQADLLAMLGGRPPGLRLGWLAKQPETHERTSTFWPPGLVPTWGEVAPVPTFSPLACST